MTKILNTARLTLHPITISDAPDFFEMHSRDIAMRYMPTPVHTTVEQTVAAFGMDMSREGAIYWAIKLKTSDKLIGYVNFLGETRFPGMGYMVHPDYWGQGYAPEACRAALALGFEELGYDRVELWINEANIASQRVAQKLDFKLKGRIPQRYSHEETYHFMYVYGMLATEWRGEALNEGAKAARFFRVEPVLMVHDVGAAALYYRDKLGFQIDFMFGDPATHAGVSAGEWTGNVVTIQLSQVPPERDLTAASYLYFVIDTQIDVLHASYRSRGVEIVSAPTDQPWGMREFVVRDNSGHTLVFATNI